MTSAVAPQGAKELAPEAVATGPTTASVSPIDNIHGVVSTRIYEDSLAGQLPVVHVRKTLTAKLCGREHDTAFNAAVISFTQRAEPFVYGTTALLIISGTSLFLVADIQVRTLASYVCAICCLIFSAHLASSMLWDVLCLVVRTFDFWFLFVINIANTMFWIVLFHDARALAMLGIGIAFTLTMAVDANIYSRRLSSRIYVVSPPTVLISLGLVIAHYPPDLHYETYHVQGVTIDIVDLLANANVTIIYFMMVRGLRAWRLVISRDPVVVVNCDVFLPVCRLTPQPTRSTTVADRKQSALAELAGTSTPSRRLQLEEHIDGHDIDITRTLLPSITRVVPTWLPQWTLNALGVIGCSSCAAAIVCKTILNTHTPHELHTLLTLTGFAASTLFLLVHTAHFQPKLAKRVLKEIDAWYVSVQISSITLGLCDSISWQPLGMLLFFTPWLWCHWTIFLDALPSVSRTRLRSSRRLIVVVTSLLVLYPMLLVYYVYYSPARSSLRNRVLLEFSFGFASMRVEIFSFLASKLFLLHVWMVRSLWREVVRPVDSFKIIELRAYYCVQDCLE